MLYSLPPDSHDCRGARLLDGRPLGAVLSYTPQMAVLLLADPDWPPKPDWLEQFNGQSGGCRIVPAVLPADAWVDGRVEPGDLLLFHVGWPVRGLRGAHKCPMPAVVDFVFAPGGGV